MKVTRKPGPAAQHLRQMIKDVESKRLAVGFFDTSKYPNGTPVAYVASIQEFGSPPIPPRPFMRPAIAANKQEWTDILRKGMKAVIDGRATVEQVYGQVGMRAAGQVSQEISNVFTPPLAAATIAARQAKRKTPGVSTKPLVDTGLMIQSVSSKVEDK